MNKSISTPRRLTLTGFFMLAVISSAFGQIVTVPAGLTLGEQYRLVFVTDGTTTATSTNIATYNTFVTNEANTTPALVALETTWTAIGSTSSTTAISNTGTFGFGPSVPIFGLNGTEVAATYTQLWSGTLGSDISISQGGNYLGGSAVWTGTTPYGERYDSGMAALGGGSGQTGYGGAGYVTSQWSLWSTAVHANSNHLYALSGVLTVAPEPGSAVLLGLGVGALLGWRRRRSV